jgi:ABC-type Mn2+/Zn2+ transport system ATPase subunit
MTETSASLLLEAHELRLSYGELCVLDGANFQVPEQGCGVLGIRGPNGAGKSTLLKAMLGLLRPTGGKLRFLGQEPGAKGFRALLSRVGYVPQVQVRGSMTFSVEEVVELGLYRGCSLFKKRKEMNKNERRAAVSLAMEHAGVAHLARRPVRELSGGQFQRVSLARALVKNPGVLCMDEPGAHLDAEGRADIVDLVARVARERERILIVVSHDPQILGLCDRFIHVESRKAIHVPG